MFSVRFHRVRCICRHNDSDGSDEWCSTPADSGSSIWNMDPNKRRQLSPSSAREPSWAQHMSGTKRADGCSRSQSRWCVWGQQRRLVLLTSARDSSSSSSSSTDHHRHPNDWELIAAVQYTALALRTTAGEALVSVAIMLLLTLYASRYSHSPASHSQHRRSRDRSSLSTAFPGQHDFETCQERVAVAQTPFSFAPGAAIILGPSYVPSHQTDVP